MARSLSFLHTSPVHIQTFDALLTELAPDIPARHIVNTSLMSIDRPMATEAVVLGSRIIVAATLSTTLIPTRELILSVARQVGKEVQIIELLCDSAWRQFEQGNQEAYLREVADNLQNAATQGDVIVLAQASMVRGRTLFRACTSSADQPAFEFARSN